MIATIAIVEDDPSLLLGLKEKLKLEGYRIISADDGEKALDLLGRHVPDLILLDLMLPKVSGLEILRWIRKRYPRLPVLILSARGQESDKVQGLRIGADDYLTKPFGLKELLARIQALLRRGGLTGRIRFGNIEVDLDAGSVRRSDAEVVLSRIEFDLLRFFLRNAGCVLSRDRILDGVWGYIDAPAARTVDYHVMGLRRKLEDDPAAPAHFMTVPTLGYKFVGPVP